MQGLTGFFRATRGRPSLPAVTVMGALRSGTNYLKFLLEANYVVRADFVAFGWKHGGVPVLPTGGPASYPNVPLFYVVKNPYAFALSLHRYHQRKRQQGHTISLVAADSWEDFLGGPIEIFDSQLDGSPRMRFANPIQYWNFIYWNLETLDRGRFRVHGLNYERLVADPTVLREIELVAPLARRQVETRTPGHHLNRLAGTAVDVVQAGYESEDDFDATYYTDRRYLDAFSGGQQSFVRAEADPWLMERRGYAAP
jgi:hypothetical protein